VRAVEDAAVRIREPPGEESGAHRDVRDVRERQEEDTALREQGSEPLEEELGPRQVLEDVARDDQVERLAPRVDQALEKVARNGVVEKRRALAGSPGVELDPREVTAVRSDAARELARAEAEVENGDSGGPREDAFEEQGVRGARDFLPRVLRRRGRSGGAQSGDLWATGTRRPVPKAFAETFRPGAA
jgi:hypothetical protein